MTEPTILPPLDTVNEHAITDKHREWARSHIGSILYVDTIILLCGDDKRVPYAAALLEEIDLSKTEKRFIIAGGTSMFQVRTQSESSRWRDSFGQYGLPTKWIEVEERSRDTFANAIYSNLMLATDERTIAILSGEKHVNRGVAPMIHANGSRRLITGYAMPIDLPISMHLTEAVVPRAINADTKHIAIGDAAGLEAYLHTQHPFHGPEHGNEPSGIYTAISRMRLWRSYETDKNALIARAKAANQ